MNHERSLETKAESPLTPEVRAAYLREWAWHIEFILAGYERHEAYPKPIAATLKERFQNMTDLIRVSTRTKQLPAFVKSETQFEKDVKDLLELYGRMRDLLVDTQISVEAMEELASDEVMYDLGQRDRLAKRLGYKYVGLFHNGIAIATTARGEFEVIRTNGSQLIDDRFKSVSHMGGGYVTGIPSGFQSRNYKIFRDTGEQLLEGEALTSVDDLREGLICVSIGRVSSDGWKNCTNYLRPDGTLLLPPEQEGKIKYGRGFHEGRAWVILESGGHQLLSETGEFLLKDPVYFDSMSEYRNGFSWIQYRQGEKDSFLLDKNGTILRDQDGEVIHVPEWPPATGNIILPVNKRGTVAFYTTTGEEIWSCPKREVDALYQFKEGIGVVKWAAPRQGMSCLKEDGTFFMKDGQAIEFKMVQECKDGVVVVQKKDGLYYCLNKDGYQINPDEPGYDEISEFQDGCVIVCRDSRCNLLRKDGTYVWKEFLSCGLAMPQHLGEGMVGIKLDNDTRIIDRSGKMLKEVAFRAVNHFDEGTLVAEIDGERAYLSHTGRRFFSNDKTV